MTKTMQAIRYQSYGPPAVLELQHIAIPEPRENEVQVKIYASGINPKDAMLRNGELKVFSGKNFPKGTGFDFSGEITALGAKVSDCHIGQKVWGFLDGAEGGAAAEYLVSARDHLSHMPNRLSFIEAAALPLVAATALQALKQKAQLKREEKLLIKGASGGVGSAAIQLAKAMGAKVTAVASEANKTHCFDLGADAFIDYKSTNLLELKERFDVIFDCFGQSPFWQYRKLLTPTGRLITIAPTASVFLNKLLSKVVPGPTTDFVFVKPTKRDLEMLAEYAEAGALRMPIDKTYPFHLTAVQQAHEDVAKKHTAGKRVLLIGQPENTLSFNQDTEMSLVG